MTELELDKLDTLSEAIDLLRSGFPLDEYISARLEEYGIDPEEVTNEFGYV